MDKSHHIEHIVIDLEFNQSYNTKKGDKSETVAECPFEIIQIGAVKLDENLDIKDQFTVLIKPQIYPKINPIVERITGITDEILDSCVNFEEAFQLFAKFAGTNSVIYTWGIDDIKSLFRNIVYFKCDTKSITNRYINIQPIAAKALNSQSGGTIGLKNAAELFGIECPLKFHDALNDASYTALVLKKIFSALPEPSVLRPEDIAPKKKNVRTKFKTKELIEYFENSLERKVTKEETAIILTAYKLGRKRKYETKNGE